VKIDGAEKIAAWDARRVIQMRKFLVICGAVLCLSLTAAAQERSPWQLGFGYQYQHYNNIQGEDFHDNGLNASVTRYLTNWFGVEGMVTAGFGDTAGTPSLDANSVFFGGGVHIAVPNQSRIEPWIHVLAGGNHFRFTQTPTLGSMTSVAFMAGGGLDFKLGGRASWRVQGDYIGTHFTTPLTYTQGNYSFGSGLVINF
jgi:Outer membrane protein beta-barrel domain